MKKAQVAVISCPDYSAGTVERAVSQGIKLLGGVRRFAAPEEKIVLKPNLLAGDSPQKAVTVHPAVFRAVAVQFSNMGAILSYGDSPARGKPEKAARISGIAAAAMEMDIPAADFVSGETRKLRVENQEILLKIASGILAADGIVSISKMKTHALTRITGAVKNLYGIIPGIMKGEFHLKYPDVFSFSRLLAELNRQFPPRLHVMDAVLAMQGNGPRSGDPFPMGVLLFSSDPVALDTVFCRLVNLDPEFVPSLKIAAEAGLGTGHYPDIEILGEDPDKLVKKDFNVVRQPAHRFVTSTYLPAFLRNSFTPRPVINYSLCRGCGACIQQCPVSPRALDWGKIRTPGGHKKARPFPEYDYSRCIRCYCCQEICPESAISVKIPWAGRLLYR